MAARSGICTQAEEILKPGEPHEVQVTPISKDFEEYWLLRKQNHRIKTGAFIVRIYAAYGVLQYTVYGLLTYVPKKSS